MNARARGPRMPEGKPGAAAESDLRLEDLLDAAERVYDKYGAKTDWTEWANLRAALVAHGREPLPLGTPDPDPSERTGGRRFDGRR